MRPADLPTSENTAKLTYIHDIFFRKP